MSIVNCELLSHSTSSHLQQLYTGFLMLHKAGIIRLRQRIIHKTISYSHNETHLTNAGHAHLDVIVDKDTRLHFDTHDSKEIAAVELEECDFYFKRSYCRSLVKSLPLSQQRKIIPLGLNYRVLPVAVDLYALGRVLQIPGSTREKMAGVKQALDVHNVLGFQPRVKQMQGFPDFKAAPKVLFLAAAYDPYDHPDRSTEKVEERIHINESRAKCIRILRRELKGAFLGGFAESSYTLKHYNDLLVPTTTTIQKNYIETLKSYPICIATTGLHGSIGWKLAEYVAFAKAIVSEELLYSAPGNFEHGRNYLKFSSPEECVDAADHLLSNTTLRHELMANNAAYYRSYVRPDSLILNAVVAALKQKSSQSVDRIRSRVKSHEHISLVYS